METNLRLLKFACSEERAFDLHLFKVRLLHGTLKDAEDVSDVHCLFKLLSEI